MITCTKNNFGCSPIEFQDYQSVRLCVLNGKFLIDTKSEEYKAAERLEINLPEAFALKKRQYQPQFLSVHQSVTVEPYFAAASTKESSALRNSRTGMKKDPSPLSWQQRLLCLDGTDNSLTLNTRKLHLVTASRLPAIV